MLLRVLETFTLQLLQLEKVRKENEVENTFVLYLRVKEEPMKVDVYLCYVVLLVVSILLLVFVFLFKSINK